MERENRNPKVITMNRLSYLLCVFCLTLFFIPFQALALDVLKVSTPDGEQEYSGRIIAKDGDNSLAIQLRDGQILLFEGENILEESKDEGEFVPYTKEELKTILKDEFPNSFSIHESKHYLIVHNTSNVYAAWSATLFEKLYTAFFSYWKKKIELTEPEYPLVVVIFASQPQFAEYAKRDLGEHVPEALRAYYQKHSNRIFMYDITETAAALGNANRITNREISVILNQPGAEFNVATIIHEAAHQVAFNSGLHERFSAYPLWLCEGLAMMFETPQMNRSGVWVPGIRMNGRRLHTLALYMQARPDDPLRAIVMSDSPLQKGNVGSVTNAYAVSWGLTYYLAMKRPADFQKYIRLMAEKENFVTASPEERLKDFEDVFGDNWPKMLNDMIKYYEAELRRMK